MWQAMQVIHAGIEKAKSTDLVPLRTALETIELESIKGPISMRACDHQIMQQGYMVKVVKKEGFETPVPDIIATFPGERTTPCSSTRRRLMDGDAVMRIGFPSASVKTDPTSLHEGRQPSSETREYGEDQHHRENDGHEWQGAEHDLAEVFIPGYGLDGEEVDAERRVNLSDLD